MMLTAHSNLAVDSAIKTCNVCTQREETGNPDFNVDRQPVVRAVAVAEPVPVPTVATPLAPPAAGLPPGAAATSRLLPSSGERPPIPQEQIVLPGEPRTCAWACSISATLCNFRLVPC